MRELLFRGEGSSCELTCARLAVLLFSSVLLKICGDHDICVYCQ